MKLKINFSTLYKSSFVFTLIVFALLAPAIPARAQTTTFTYQGRLNDGAAPASGLYDFRFTLFDAGGVRVGPTQAREDVSVSNGVFTVQLDAAVAVNAFDGAARFLEISVRRGSETGAFTILSPRQPVTSAPYAIRAAAAGAADTATNAERLGGTAADRFVQTNDARLGDERNPAAGSGNYIQNQNAAVQPSTDFRISGTGAANIFNAQTQFNLSGNRVFIAEGTENLFAGIDTGISNAPAGDFNSFFGTRAGRSNTNGSSNSFFGTGTGTGNLTGGDNSFFGTDAGVGNTTGNFNSFFGRNAGQTNASGSNNTLIGYNTAVAASNLSFATALGAGAVVSESNTVVLGRGPDVVRVPGALITGGSITIGNALRVGNLPSGDFQNVQWDPASKQFFQDSSSRRFKENIRPLETDFNRLLFAAPKTYTRADNPNRWEIGFIAEELDELGLQPLVNYDAAGQPEGIRYDKITLYLTRIAAQQREQIERRQKENSDLQERFDRQQTQLEAQQRQIEELKKIVCRSEPGASICEPLPKQ